MGIIPSLTHFQRAYVLSRKEYTKECKKEKNMALPAGLWNYRYCVTILTIKYSDYISFSVPGTSNVPAGTYDIYFIEIVRHALKVIAQDAFHSGSLKLPRFSLTIFFIP